MSEAAAPSADTLAPPAKERSNSAASSRSNSSRRGHRSRDSSASVSRSNSHSSGGHSDRRKNNGNTTTISGGTSLGGNKAAALIMAGVTGTGDSKQQQQRTRTKGDASKQSISRRSSVKAAPPRPSSANKDKQQQQQQQQPGPAAVASTAVAVPIAIPIEPTAEQQVRSLHTTTSPPVTAMEAAVTAATKKHVETHGGDALSSLQRMISDLKAISPTSSNPGSRNVSASGKDKLDSASSTSSTHAASEPVSIPSPTSSTRLKADAPSFTPGSLRSGTSPTTSTTGAAPQQPGGSGRSARRTSNASATGSFTGAFGPTSPLQAGYTQLPHFPLASAGFQNPQDGGEGFPYSQHSDMFQQQQLLAAQQLQLQILQAQIVQQQLAAQQQQREQGFIAPRFQALAAQRAALQQQQQQTAQLAEAQRLFEMHQQQQLLFAHQQQQQPGGDGARPDIPLISPPAVFEEDSPEPTPTTLGPTGRPQLNPGFTFGKRRESGNADDKSRRSEAAATLGGLAARAHKRSGSEITPAMEEQLEIQRQIEALQMKQKELMNRDLAPGDKDPRHRRTMSNVSSGSAAGGPPGLDSIASSILAQQPGQPDSKMSRSFQDVQASGGFSGAGSHSRRHSMFTKGAGSGAGFGEYVIDDGGSISIPAGAFGHHRGGSRAGMESGNWRNGGGGGGGPGGNTGTTADLASAQAQLASLAQFRAAAGSGHAKMASFSFPNMLPNLLVATTLQNPSGQSSLWQQQQAFQMQLQQNAQGPQRKSLFAPYLPQASLPPLLSAGKLVVGILRVNKKNRSDAYVATDVLDADIYICGSKDRNRALEGDIVAVELLDVDEVWTTKKDKEEKKRKKEESYDIKPSAAKKLEKKKDDIEVEGQGLTLFEDEEVNDDTKPTYAGHVVAVVERMPGQLFSGQLGVLRPSSAATKEKQEAERREREGDKKSNEKSEPEPRPKIVWFKPTDKRVPLIAIPTEQAPIDFIENPEAHTNKLFVATIKRWPITSLHPFGTLVEELGPIGNVEVETSAILKDCNFPTEEFTDVALKCLPPLPWTIPDREYEVRLDLREDCVFSIDPTGARDLDDALSIKTNEDGSYSVGVHIADVSYFVKTNTALDRDARKRATSVYLVQRAVPMLPPLLCEQLCSLVPDVERLAFSAMFVIDKEGNVLEKSFRRSIVKSTAQLSYADAAAVIAGNELPATANVSIAHPASKVEGDIKLLHDLATKLRAKRMDNGSMFSNRSKLSFVLDDTGRAIDTSVSERNDANNLVEEFMVLTNIAAAAVVANALPEQALLRRHEAPAERRMDAFVQRAKRLGYAIDPKNAGTIQKSFNKITDQEAVYALSVLEKKCMPTARYFCTGMLDIAKFSHWALNAPLYTHFTSPIRRYADVLVHRMLDAIVSNQSSNSDVKFHMDRDQVAKCAQQCNIKRSSARLAEDQSAHLYLCMLISDLSEKYGPVIRHARVTAVYDQAFDVVIPEFGLEKRVHVDKMPLKTSTFDEHKNVLSLYWTTQDVLLFLTQSNEDEHLLKIKQRVEGQATGATQAADANALFDDSDAVTVAETSAQYQKSAAHTPLVFEGLRDGGNHRIQDVKEFSSLPVIITADMSKSPPVLVIYACKWSLAGCV